MTIIDMGKHLGQYEVLINHVSPGQLFAEALEVIREAIAREDRPVDAILVGEQVYQALVCRRDSRALDGELPSYRPDLVLNGIRVYVCRDEDERFCMRWDLWDAGKKILEVVE